MYSNKSCFLDVDSKILENNLLLDGNKNEADVLDTVFGFNTNSKNVPWELVTPDPGFVLKITDSDGKKIFINLCKCEHIPEAKDISEEEVLRLCNTDETSDFRLPLSMLDPHEELDKSGKLATVYDVAINTKYFNKLADKQVLKAFVIQVVIEGIENKYNIELNKEDYVILRNRKCIGKLKPHRIRCSEGQYKPPKRLIEEVNSYSNNKLTMHGTEGKFESSYETHQKLIYRLLYGNNIISGQFYLPNIKTYQDVQVDVSDNRIVLETRHEEHSTDIFLPHKIDVHKTIAHFNQAEKVLTVLMPCLVPC